jgi:chaperonin GroEL (HSP60 family)
MKILTIKDVERDDIEFICKSVGCKPIASLDHFTPEMLGHAESVETASTGDGKIVKVDPASLCIGRCIPAMQLSYVLRDASLQYNCLMY